MRRRWKWPGIVLLVGAAGVGGYLAITGTSAELVVELLAEEGDRVLREPLRAPRGAPRVLVFALDGVGEDELRAAVGDGAAPQLAALFGAPAADGTFAHGYIAPDVMSVLPSTTLAAWSAVFTGRPPAFTGVPGNEFFVRERERYVAPAPVSVTEVADLVRTYAENLIGSVQHAPTLYERAAVRSYVALSQLHRGADLLIVPDVSSMGDMVTAAAEGLLAESDEADEYSELDEESAEMTVRAIAEHGVADLQVVYFPGVDLFTHVARQPLQRQREYVSLVIDRAIGIVLDAYRAAGVLDDTYIVIVSDHGHTPVLDDDRHSLSADGDDEPTAVITRAGYRLRPNVVTPDSADDYQAAVAYQGAFAYVYVADRSTCAAAGTKCDWSRPPRLEQDVLPLVRAFDDANRSGLHVPALHGTIDLIFARTPRPTTEDALPFEVWDGTRLVPVAEYLARHPRPDLIDLDARLRGLAAGPYGHRAGDILLLAKSGAQRPIEERFYFSGRYRSWHGSPDAQDSRIVFAVVHGRSSGTALRDRVQRVAGGAPSQLHVTPLILDLLGR